MSEREDWPVLDNRCPKCGWFVADDTKVVIVNKLDDVVRHTGECKRCGTVELQIIGWSGDFNDV